MLHEIAIPREVFIAAIRQTQKEIEDMEQVDCPLQHELKDGDYHRTIFMPAGSFIIGRTHKTEHLNIITRGAAHVFFDGKIEYLKAPCQIMSAPGVKKVLFITEDMEWTTIHKTECETIEDLEDCAYMEAALVLTEEEEAKALEVMLKTEEKEVLLCHG